MGTTKSSSKNWLTISSILSIGAVIAVTQDYHHAETGIRFTASHDIALLYRAPFDLIREVYSEGTNWSFFDLSSKAFSNWNDSCKRADRTNIVNLLFADKTNNRSR